MAPRASSSRDPSPFERRQGIVVPKEQVRVPTAAGAPRPTPLRQTRDELLESISLILARAYGPAAAIAEWSRHRPPGAELRLKPVRGNQVAQACVLRLDPLEPLSEINVTGRGSEALAFFVLKDHGALVPIPVLKSDWRTRPGEGDLADCALPARELRGAVALVVLNASARPSQEARLVDLSAKPAVAPDSARREEADFGALAAVHREVFGDTDPRALRDRFEAELRHRLDLPLTRALVRGVPRLWDCVLRQLSSDWGRRRGFESPDDVLHDWGRREPVCDPRPKANPRQALESLAEVREAGGLSKALGDPRAVEACLSVVPLFDLLATVLPPGREGLLSQASSELANAASLAGAIVRFSPEPPRSLEECVRRCAPRSEEDLQLSGIAARTVSGRAVGRIYRGTAPSQGLIQKPNGLHYSGMDDFRRPAEDDSHLGLLTKARRHATGSGPGDVDTPFTSWTSSPEVPWIRRGYSNLAFAEVPADELMVNPYGLESEREVLLTAARPDDIFCVVGTDRGNAPAIRKLLDSDESEAPAVLADLWPSAQLVYDRKTQVVDSASHGRRGEGPATVAALAEDEASQVDVDRLLSARGARRLAGRISWVDAKDEVEHPRLGILRLVARGGAPVSYGVPFAVDRWTFALPDGSVTKLPVLSTRKRGFFFLEPAQDRPRFDADPVAGTTARDRLGASWRVVPLPPRAASEARVLARVFRRLGVPVHPVDARAEGLVALGEELVPGDVALSPARCAVRTAALVALFGRAPLRPEELAAPALARGFATRGGFEESPAVALSGVTLRAAFGNLGAAHPLRQRAGALSAQALDDELRALLNSGLLGVLADALRAEPGMTDDRVRAWQRAIEDRVDPLRSELPEFSATSLLRANLRRTATDAVDVAAPEGTRMEALPGSPEMLASELLGDELFQIAGLSPQPREVACLDGVLVLAQAPLPPTPALSAALSVDAAEQISSGPRRQALTDAALLHWLLGVPLQGHQTRREGIVLHQRGVGVRADRIVGPVDMASLYQDLAEAYGNHHPVMSARPVDLSREVARLADKLCAVLPHAARAAELRVPGASLDEAALRSALRARSQRLQASLRELGAEPPRRHRRSKQPLTRG